MTLVRVHTPDTEAELLAIVAMFDAYEVPHFVENAGFGSLYPGPLINSYNVRVILVPEEHVRAARELLKDFQSSSGGQT